jgi:hypothetical protein
MLHPLTHEVFRVPNSALVIDEHLPVRLSPAQLERVLNGGPLIAERVFRARGNADLHTLSDTFDAHEIVLVRLRSSESVPTAYTWGVRVSLMDARAAAFGTSELHWLSLDPGARFLFLWNPGRAHNASLTRRARNANGDGVHHDIDDPLLAPTLAYKPKFAGTGMPLGPDDIDGCTRVDVRSLRREERVYVANIPPLAMLSGASLLPDNEWSDQHAEAATRRHAEFLAYERKDSQTGSTTLALAGAGASAGVHVCAMREEAPTRKFRRCAELAERWHETRLGLPPNATLATRLAAADLGVSPPPDFRARARALHTVEADANATGGVRAHGIIPLADTLDRLLTAQRRKVWKELPAELLVKVLGHLISNSLVNDLSSDAAKTYGAVRLLCHDGRHFADGLLLGQLALLHDAVQQLWRPNVQMGNKTVCATALRCFPLGNQTPEEALAMPDPAQLSARVHALGVTCNDLFDLQPLSVGSSPRANWPQAPERKDNPNQWPLSEYGFVYAPSARGYFRARRRHETKTRSREGVMSAPRRPAWLRRNQAKRGHVAARLLGELQNINPSMHLLLSKDDNDHLQQLERLESASVPATSDHAEDRLLADARVG